jgi:hypothetical protein
MRKLGSMILTVMIVTIVVATSVTGQDRSQKQRMQPLVTITGADSKLMERGYYRVVDATELANLWQDHRGLKREGRYNYFRNVACVPEVNFDECMVVAVFQGEGWNSAGLELKEIVEKDAEIILRFDDKSYQTGAEADKVSPYAFFVIPRNDKVLMVEEDVRTYSSQPASWKQRQRFEKLEM